MRLSALLIISIVFAFVLQGCTEEVVTKDIFELEEASVENLTSVELDGMGTLYVNSDRINIQDGLAQIKGTLFTKVEDQYVALTSGDFTLSDPDANGVYGDFVGYGKAAIPEIGAFGDIVTELATGADFGFQNGTTIRANDELAPVQEELNYFGITLNEQIGEKLEFKIKNTVFTPEAFYMDPNDPMIYFRGNLGTPKFAVEDAGIGLSARGNLQFTPFEYSDELESIMKVPLSPIDGNIFISGLVPIPKFNISVYGEALIGFVLNDNGFTDFFEQGFEDAQYRMGINGQVLLDEGFISFLPETELGRATVILELEQSADQYIQVAGEMQMTADFLPEMLGKLDGGVLSSSFSMPVQKVESYFYVGNDVNNSQFFIRTTLSMTVPGIGEQELIEAMFGVDSQQIFIGGSMGVPGLALVYIEGDVYYDGRFRLAGGASLEVDVEVAKLKVGFDVVVTNEGFAIEAVARGEIAEQSVEVSASVKLNWETGDMEICMDLPVVGNTCASFREGQQRTLNGRLYRPQL